MFEVNDIIVYRNHVCKIARVREEYFEGRDYYELHTLFEGTLKLYVATSEAKPPAMRHAMTRKEAMLLIEEIPCIEAIDESTLNLPSGNLTRSVAERQLKEEYVRCLSQCSPRDLVIVVKSAYERTRDRESTGKNAMSVDKKFLELAEKLLCDELSVSLDMPREQVLDYLKEQVRQLARGR